MSAATTAPDRPPRLRRFPVDSLVRLLPAVLMAGIALAALQVLAARLAEVAAEIASRQTLAGLVAVVLYVLVAVGWVIGLGFFAGRMGGRWALALGLIATGVTRFSVAFAADAPLVDDWLASHADAARFAADGVALGDRAPGYPALLAGAYALFGPEPWVAEALNVVLGLLAAALLFDLLRRANGPVVAAVGIGLFAAMPSQALFVPVISWESTLTVALLAAAWCLTVVPGWRPRLAGRTPDEAVLVTAGAAAAGVLLGLAQYVRPTSVFLLPAMVILAMLVAGDRRPRRAAVALSLAFALVMLPALVDNATRHGQLSLWPSSEGGASLYAGTNPAADGRPNEADTAQVATLPGATPRERSDEAGRQALGRVADDVGSFARLAVRKEAILWGDDEYATLHALDAQVEPRPSGGLLTGAYVASSVAWAFVALAATAGALRVRRRLPAWAVAGVLLVVSTALVHVFFAVEPRFHAPLAPFVIGLAALGLASGTARGYAADDPVRGAEARPGAR